MGPAEAGGKGTVVKGKLSLKNKLSDCSLLVAGPGCGTPCSDDRGFPLTGSAAVAVEALLDAPAIQEVAVEPVAIALRRGLPL